MLNISFIKKIKLYLEYRKNIFKIENELLSNFNIKIDKAARLYTVMNIPPNLIEEPYNIRKADVDAIATLYIKTFSGKLADFLNTKGLYELYTFYDSSKIGEYSYLLIYGFSLFKSDKFLLKLYKYVSIILLFFILFFILFKTFH